MTTTEQISQQLKALPPELPDADDRLERIEGGVVRRRRRLATASAAGALAIVLAGWGLTQVVGDEEAFGPAGSTETTAPGVEFSNRSPGTILGSTPLAEGEVIEGAGVQEVDLSAVERPAGTEAYRLLVECSEDANVLWADVGIEAWCRELGELEEAAYRTYPLSYYLPVEDAAEPFLVQVSDDVPWEMLVEPVEMERIPLGVNSRGQTYGKASPFGQPDLLEVRGDDLVAGYLDRAALEERTGRQPRTFAEWDAWRERETEPIEVPLYDADGVTVVGSFEIQIPVDDR